MGVKYPAFHAHPLAADKYHVQMVFLYGAPGNAALHGIGLAVNAPARGQDSKTAPLHLPDDFNRIRQDQDILPFTEILKRLHNR